MHMKKQFRGEKGEMTARCSLSYTYAMKGESRSAHLSQATLLASPLTRRELSLRRAFDPRRALGIYLHWQVEAMAVRS